MVRKSDIAQQLTEVERQADISLKSSMEGNRKSKKNDFAYTVQPTRRWDLKVVHLHDGMAGQVKIKTIWLGGKSHSFSLPDNVLTMALCTLPSMEETKAVVFALSVDSAYGPDGLSGVFYQSCWEIVGTDVHDLVKDFFEGNSLPKSITYKNMVFLPKKAIINTFSYMRPISLRNFINKLVSRVVNDRLEGVLSSLIFQNESGFVKVRNIIKNLLLTHEIVTDIRKREKPANVDIKLDMEKCNDSLGRYSLFGAL
ncbi:uncharacterized protein LOC132644093 [Lycium barbarum]|uniref:uncharacterized protein LOC132644093 n=1 Tax=Lycium barbarum TaxID=112863 RepID=UPI00293EE933|nr:uncharacterized protein LOC132644093 [Lycium barbarum]